MSFGVAAQYIAVGIAISVAVGAGRELLTCGKIAYGRRYTRKAFPWCVIVHGA
jgi:hypothetical protein